MKIDQVIQGNFLSSVLFSVAGKVDKEKNYRVVIKEARARSLDQNALMWMWLTIMAEHFTAKGIMADGEPLTKDDMHDIMRSKFLGSEDVVRTIGNTVIKEHKLKSTANLDKGDMHHYLTQMDQWAAEHGCLLPHPEDCEYERLREAQVA